MSFYVQKCMLMWIKWSEQVQMHACVNQMIWISAQKLVSSRHREKGRWYYPYYHLVPFSVNNWKRNKLKLDFKQKSENRLESEETYWVISAYSLIFTLLQNNPPPPTPKKTCSQPLLLNRCSPIDLGCIPSNYN